MKSITIHKISDEVAEKITLLSKKTGLSQNKVVKKLLEKALGLNKQSNPTDFSAFSGIWDDQEFSQFEDAISGFNTIDEDLWT